MRIVDTRHLGEYGCVCLLGFGLLVGCERVETANMPWAAPGVRTEQRSKDVGHLGAGPQQKTWWVDANGNRLEMQDVATDVMVHLTSTGLVETWPEVHRLKLAPFDFTVVSITPTVVVMKPHDFGPYNEQTFGDIDNNEQYGPGGGTMSLKGLRIRRLLNRIRYETTVDHDPNLQWFSPDLKLGPSTITFPASGVATIALPDGKLVLTRRGSQVDVTRE